jgi:hypothetical protein
MMTRVPSSFGDGDMLRTCNGRGWNERQAGGARADVEGDVAGREVPPFMRDSASDDGEGKED